MTDIARTNTTLMDSYRPIMSRCIILVDFQIILIEPKWKRGLYVMKKGLLIGFGLFAAVMVNVSTVHAAERDFSNIYDVKPGDSLWKIADKYDTSVADLKSTNGLQSDLLLVGQKLWVPTVYKVVAGDTLWKLAMTYNSSVQSIQTANGLSSDLIYVEQTLKIPPKKLVMQGQYVLMTKEQFRDWLFHNQFLRTINLIQEHHTLSPSYKDFNGSNYFALLKGMEDYHVKVMGWSTISQNLTTFPDGKIAVCRPFDTPPQGSFGFQNKVAGAAVESRSLAIENVGNFDSGKDIMTDPQRETIVYMTALLCMRFGLTPSIDTITYHHWWDMNTAERVLDNSAGHAVKTCPGTAFFGGNSTTSATQNFYPLISGKIQEISASRFNSPS